MRLRSQWVPARCEPWCEPEANRTDPRRGPRGGSPHPMSTTPSSWSPSKTGPAAGTTGADRDPETGRPKPDYGLRWWREVLYIAVFYVRLQRHPQHPGLGRGVRGARPAQRPADRRLGAGAGDLPGGGDPAGLPRVAPLHRVLERVLRHLPLHRHRVRPGPAVPPLPRAVPAVAQHAGRGHGRRPPRLRLLPADAAPAHARVLRVRRHPARSSAARGRSTPAP